jgi:hypothetical protein
MVDNEVDGIGREAAKVLKHNNRGQYTAPAGDLYPHQWLWDSCFIAIGLRHTNLIRAQTELKSLLRGQWSNGMLPNIIFASGDEYYKDREIWRSRLSPYAPSDVATTGITQPPMLAEAILKIGDKMKITERRGWYKKMLPHLIRYHEWMYAERDPHDEGLIILIHPYECGLDNSPPWISELRKHGFPWWVRMIETLHLDKLINKIRRDTTHVPPGQRMTNVEAAAYWAALHRLRKKAYNSEAILSRSLFAVQDLAFNCILIRANVHLQNMKRSEEALKQLWDEASGQYYSRSFVSHKLIEESTIAGLLPLYAGTIPKQKAERLVELLNSRKWFKTVYPIPSVPVNSPDFDPFKYWQGPSWVNTNWLIIEGLKNYGFKDEAEDLKQKTLKMVEVSGLSEYFNPLTGEPAGAANFSWTAALIIDFLNQ